MNSLKLVAKILHSTRPQIAIPTGRGFNVTALTYINVPDTDCLILVQKRYKISKSM